MRNFVLLAFVLIALPSVNAQGGLYVSEHNLTYFLGDADFYVEEKITFENTGTPSFTFSDTVYFRRGDATDVRVNGRAYKAATGIISVDLQVSKGQRIRLDLSYRRSDLLRDVNSVKEFSGLALGLYPWPVNRANIVFVAPEDAQFGDATEGGKLGSEGGKETLSYSISIFEDPMTVRNGVPIMLQYANFRELAGNEIAAAREMVLDADYALNDAGKIIKNARGYDINLTASILSYNSSVAQLQTGQEQLKFAEENYNLKNYYLAYENALASKQHSREAFRKASDAKNQANLDMQRALEKRISEIGALMQQREQLEKSVETGDTERLTRYFMAAIFIILVVMFGQILFSSRKLRSSRSDVGKTYHFRGIDDLKLKEFSGFEDKVQRVKKVAEIADQINSKRKEKSRLAGEIERIRTDMLAGKLVEAEFESRKKELQGKIDLLDSELNNLEKRLEASKKESNEGR